jgi:hypothetical protein
MPSQHMKPQETFPISAFAYVLVHGRSLPQQAVSKRMYSTVFSFFLMAMCVLLV